MFFHSWFVQWANLTVASLFVFFLLKTASPTFFERKNRKRLKLQLIRPQPSVGISGERWYFIEKKGRKKNDVLGKVGGVAVTLKQWWRDVGLCPRAAPSTVGGPLAARHRCCHTNTRGSTRSMGQALSMCKLNQCRHKKSKF